MNYLKRIHLAEHALKVSIFPTSKRAKGTLGIYMHADNKILYNDQLAVPQKYWIIAHELGHANHKDIACSSSYLERKQERRADIYAARLLIKTDELCKAWSPGMTDQEIADELQVDVEAVTLFKSLMSDKEKQHLKEKTLVH